MISRSLCAAVIMSMVLVVPFMSMQGAAGAGPEAAMNIETIGTPGNASECRIALGPGGSVHLSYFDQDTGALMYATNAGGSWTEQTISSGLAVGASSIAVDSEGAAHVSYVGNDDGGYGDLIYATNVGGAWDNQIIDDGVVLGLTSIAVDSRDKVHMSYHTGGSYENDNLRYATDKSGRWSTELVDGGQAGWYSAIAVDAAGNVHIAAYAGIGGKPLRYSTNAGGAWSSQDIEASVWIGGQCSIATDSSGAPHVAISTSGEISQVDLKHAVYSAGVWTSEAIEIGGYVWDRSIAIDGGDAVHICYRSYADNALMYKTNSGGSWTTMNVDLLGASTSHASLAVDAAGNAHICYTVAGATGSELRYARIGGELSSQEVSAPTGLMAAVVDGKVHLTWNAPVEGDGSSYIVYRGTGPADMVSIATVSGTSYLDDDLEVDGRFIYQVVAVEGNVQSEAINTAVDVVAYDAVEPALEDPPLTAFPTALIAVAGLVAVIALAAVLLTRRRAQ